MMRLTGEYINLLGVYIIIYLKDPVEDVTDELRGCEMETNAQT